MTVIDSLVVELGLDPSKFTKGQQQAFDAAKKLEDQVARSGKSVEESSAKMGDSLGAIRSQALQLFAVFTGGKTALGFARDLTHANAQLGRLERNIGVSASTISKWQSAARIFGGDAQQMATSFQTISDAFAGWKIGVVSPLIADLRAISTAGGKIIDVNKGVEQSFLDLSENLKRIHDRDPAQAGLLGRRIGLDPALYDLLVQGPDKLQKVLDYVQKIGTATHADVDAFGELEKRISQMGLKAESLGRKLLGGEGGGAQTIIGIADWLNLPPGEALDQAKQGFTDQVQRSGGYGGFLKDLFTFNWWGNSGVRPQVNSLFTPGGSGGGKFTSQAEKEAYIRAAAAKRGINPNTAMAVARSEGFNSFQSTVPVPGGPNGREDSWGAFQLYMGGGLGNEFQKATGLDPRDPANERATIDYALDHARKSGWGAFHGAKNTGIGPWSGIDRNAGGGGNTTEVNIGQVNVTAPAGSDPATFAERFSAAVKRQSYTAQSNNGQN